MIRTPTISEIVKVNNNDRVTMEVSTWRGEEIMRCYSNPLYYILNYVCLPEIGGEFRYSDVPFHRKLDRVVRSIYKHHKCIMMASRQLGKSSIAAALLSWALLFYPGNHAVILNMRKDAAQKNIKTIKFIIEHLPTWMRDEDPFVSKAEIKSYLEFRNGSSIVAYYPSASHSPDTLARSLTVPLLYIDEAAFIRHIDDIYGSAQQTLSRARDQAIKNRYPYFILVTSTPNGTQGDGQFFYDMWNLAAESDEIFEDTGKIQEDWGPNAIDVINDPSKNSFIRVEYHWSEDPMKTEAWYQEQCRELNFNERKINQELDLKFVGSSDCVFSDSTLEKLRPIKSPMKVSLINQTTLNLYDDFNPKDYYLIGVDTASSLKGSFNAVEIFSFKKFVQVGEIHTRMGSLTKYGQVVDDLFRKIQFHVNDRIILCIENNSIGKAIIEHLMYHVNDIDYTQFMYREDPKKDYGINTNTSTREMMVDTLFSLINENPLRIKSKTLCNHLSTVERTQSGRINCSDSYMASSFCAYVRRKKIFEIMPQIDIADDQVEKNNYRQLKSIVSLSNFRTFDKKAGQETFNVFSNVTTADQDAIFSQQFMNEEEFSGFFPIFGSENESGGIIPYYG